MSVLDRIYKKHQAALGIRAERAGAEALATLRKHGHKVELLDDDRVLIEPPPPDSWIARLREVKPKLIEALKAEQRQEVKRLAITTAWTWTINTGTAGTHHSTALTYDEARAELEQRFPGRKVTHLEFISAIAEGFGFVAYRPEIGETKQ